MTTAELVMPELDERDREAQRYAAYAVGIASGARLAGGVENRRELMSTPTLDGIGQMLDLLRSEGGITDDTRVGILDRVEHKWLINPWAKGVLD